MYPSSMQDYYRSTQGFSQLGHGLTQPRPRVCLPLKPLSSNNLGPSPLQPAIPLHDMSQQQPSFKSSSSFWSRCKTTQIGRGLNRNRTTIPLPPNSKIVTFLLSKVPRRVGSSVHYSESHSVRPCWFGDSSFQPFGMGHRCR